MLGLMLDPITKATSKTAYRELLISFLERKILQADIKPSRTFLNKLADHFQSESGKEFDLPKKYLRLDDPNFFDVIDDDKDFLAKKSEKIAAAQAPIITRLVKLAPVWLLERLTSNWPKQYALEEKDADRFKKRLRKRWGKALDKIRMMLTISREFGAEKLNALEVAPPPRSLKVGVLVRLHVRACQVTAEIITLMENGYADGAMARWRTLQEIVTIATLIAKNDEELAERYLAHDAIESKKAAELYALSNIRLGFEPIPTDELTDILSRYNSAIATFGPEFKEEYGWASKHLSNKKPNFFSLLDAIDQSHMKSYYKMASYNVHAGTRGIGFKHGALDGYPPLLAGASNAGFEEPVQNTAISFLEITSLLFDAPHEADEGIYLAVITKLKDQATKAAITAGQKLIRDEKKFRKVNGTL